MDHCWHTVFSKDLTAGFKCCFCGQYHTAESVVTQKANYPGHGPYAPVRNLVEPPKEGCPKR